MKKKSNAGVRHNPKKVGRPHKIGVEKGFGPRHAANAKEGEDLTQRDTDTVPAMLTPREAVLNRNAAEMAGRRNIEALNERGNELAKRGVDLAAKGDSDVDERDLGPMLDKWTSGMSAQELKLLGPLLDEFLRHREVASKMKVGDLRPDLLGGSELGRRHAADTLADFSAEPQMTRDSPALEGSARWRLPGYAKGTENMKSRQKLQGGDDAVARNPFPGRGPGGVYPPHGSIAPPGTQLPPGPPDQIGGFGGGLGARDEFGRQFSQRGAGGFYGAGNGVPQPGGPQPMPVTPTGGWQAQPAPLQSAPFYPPGQGLRMAQGEEDILGGGESIYGKSAPVQLSAPGGLGDLVKAITSEAQKQGLNANQIAGILKMVQGMGGGSGLTVGAGTGNMDAVGAFQGGISDIGYPPFVAPNADFHGDKGGWVGPYDSLYMIPTYQRGTGNVPG